MPLNSGRLGFACVLVVACAAADFPAQAQSAPALAGKPVWTRKPSSAELSALRPARVVSERVPGGAVIDCVVSAAGALGACKVEQEAPKGYGYGAAALKAAALFRMAPRTAEGQATAGASVHVSVTFDAKQVGGAMTLANYPIWTHAPTLAAVEAAYPAAAGGAAGKAVVRCAFDVEGRATDCDIRSETPAGKGFGGAALGLADTFVLRHEAGDADVLPGVVADIPINFHKPDGGGGRLAEPHWLTELTPAAAEDLFPAAARAAKLTSGGGTVNCLVGGDGGLSDCRVAREQPSNLGFGEAALQASKLLVLSPWSNEGEPFAGRRLTVPIRLRLVDPPLTGKPVWTSRPSDHDLFVLHPTKLGASKLAGGAVLNCVVTAIGTLGGCTIENEEPKNLDFGAAALETAPLFRMQPRTAEGQTTAGTRIRVPIKFAAEPSQ